MAGSFKFDIDEAPSQENLNVLYGGLREHQLEVIPQPGFLPHAVWYREAGVIRAGISGVVNWNWAFAQAFWVAKELRRRHVGSQLLAAYEDLARRKGCTHIHLDTFSFQAPKFYERQGYTCFAVLDDYPGGHKRHFYKKRLV